MLLNKNQLTVIEEFLRGYDLKLTGSEIARKRRLNQKSVANLLNELEEQTIFRSTVQGRNKLYFLNIENEEMARQFLASVEQLRTFHFYQSHPLIREIASKLLVCCDSNSIVLIFGSYARGKEKEGSDLDVFVTFIKPDEKAVEKIEQIYGVEINITYYTMENFTEGLKRNDHFIQEILKDHLLLKGADDFVYWVTRKRYGKA